MLYHRTQDGTVPKNHIIHARDTADVPVYTLDFGSRGWSMGDNTQTHRQFQT